MVTPVGSGNVRCWICVIALMLIEIVAFPAWASSDHCAGLLPPNEPLALSRPVEPIDLARLRDFGMVEQALPDASPFAVSPDKRRVAVILRRADPVTNQYCQGLVVISIDKTVPPRLIDRGGEFLRYRIPDLRGAIFPSGSADVVSPAWSPDGRWIAYRKRIAGHTRVWLVRSDGGDGHALAHDGPDVYAVAWDPGGKELILSDWRAVSQAERAIDAEGDGGWLYDSRTLPIAGARPFPQGPLPRNYTAIAIDGSQVHPATDAQRHLLDPVSGPEWPSGATTVSRRADGNVVWTGAENPVLYLSPNRLWARRMHGRPRLCDDISCQGKIAGAWWSEQKDRVHFVRRDGWADSEFTFYTWRPGSGAPRRTFTTPDIFSNCEPLHDTLLCDRDASSAPRQIVLLNPESGKFQTVFDPNPEFGALKLGRVTRLHWRTLYGTACYGDLVLPPDHRPGQRHPLIIVQYRTKGFLRGAVGDQYPIQAFAARGYAILSVERVPFWAEAQAQPGDTRTSQQFQKANLNDWIDRRNLLSSILTGVDLVTKLGVANPGRVGITGVSEGATSTLFALNNSTHFAAASLGGCCMDPKTSLIMGGEAWAKHLQQSGYPRYTADGAAFWKPMSLAMNADHVIAPVLMQMPDDEYLLGLESYESLKEHGRAVEMRIFPGEHHYIWQPAHRLSIYNRNLDWFDFWLRGIEDPDPSKKADYLRWRSLRQRSECVKSAGAAAAESLERCNLLVNE